MSLSTSVSSINLPELGKLVGRNLFNISHILFLSSDDSVIDQHLSNETPNLQHCIPSPSISVLSNSNILEKIDLEKTEIVTNTSVAKNLPEYRRKKNTYYFKGVNKSRPFQPVSYLGESTLKKKEHHQRHSSKTLKFENKSRKQISNLEDFTLEQKPHEVQKQSTRSVRGRNTSKQPWPIPSAHVHSPEEKKGISVGMSKKKKSARSATSTIVRNGVEMESTTRKQTFKTNNM